MPSTAERENTGSVNHSAGALSMINRMNFQRSIKCRHVLKRYSSPVRSAVPNGTGAASRPSRAEMTTTRPDAAARAAQPSSSSARPSAEAPLGPARHSAGCGSAPTERFPTQDRGGALIRAALPGCTSRRGRRDFQPPAQLIPSALITVRQQDLRATSRPRGTQRRRRIPAQARPIGAPQKRQ